MARTKKKKFVLTSFSIIFIIIVLLGIISHLLPKASFVGEDIVNGSGVVGAKISDILSAPILGFQDAADVCIFIFVNAFHISNRTIYNIIVVRYFLFVQKILCKFIT